jgi:hypothetical protein
MCIPEVRGPTLVLAIDFHEDFHSFYKQMPSNCLTIRHPVLSRFLLIIIRCHPISTRGP